MRKSDRQQLSIEEQKALDAQERYERAQRALDDGNLLAILAYHGRILAVAHSRPGESWRTERLHNVKQTIWRKLRNENLTKHTSNK